MTSKIKVDNINKVSDDSNIIKKCGTTTTIGSGASNPIVVDGSAITLGRCGGTVALASGATQTGFGRSGSVNWQTTPKTGTFVPVNGEGYFVNTSGGVSTANLPAGSAGAIVSFADYTRTFATNALTVVPNGSEKIGGVAASASLVVNGQAATFIYVDGTEGWINTQETQTTQTGLPPYITATGGTVTCSGDYRIHTFTGSGSFVVTSAGSAAPSSGTGSNKVDYLVVAAGGSGGSGYGGGGGAGGYRESPGADNGSYTVSPLGASPAVSLSLITGTTYPITVGAGGAQIPAGGPGSGALGPSGTNSTFSTITSAGGGGGGGSTGPSAPNPTADGADGGSGGGGSWDAPGTGGTALGGTGNTPPVSPAQGKNGGTGRHLGPSYSSQGGGGGAISNGANQQPGTDGNVGGGGATSSINGTPTARAGGGGAAGSPGAGGTGGGGSGSPSPVPARGGGVNTGGGGGGALPSASYTGAGGSGIVILRYKYQN